MSRPANRDIAERQWRRFVRARDAGHDQYVRRAIRQNSYYSGNQWDPEVVEELRSQGRPALTINMVTPTINAMIGEFASRRSDVVFRPRRGGSQDTADTLTKVHAQIADANGLEWITQRVFEDALVMDGRGYFDVRIGYEDNVYGEVSVSAVDPLNVIPDPDAKTADTEEWNEVFTMRWLSLDEIAAAYGKGKATAIKDMGERGFEFGSDEDVFRRESTFGEDDRSRVPFRSDADNEGLRDYLVVERQHRVPGRRNMLIDPETGDERPVPQAWDDMRAEEYAIRNRLLVIPRMARKIRWTVTCGSVVLHDEDSPYDFITIVPSYAYFRRGNPFGPIRLMMSPQDQLNKVSSQELHIINTTANSGWIIQEDSLVGKEASDLEVEGAETGLVLEVARGAEVPQKIQPNQIPAGLDRVGMKALGFMKEISGISDAMRGATSPEVSGVAIEAQTGRAAVMLQVPFENHRRAEQRVAEHVLSLVQRYYTEERLIQITDEDDPLKPRAEMMVNEPTPEGTILNDLTVGEYDTVISRAPARDSFDEMQFAEALSLRSVGVEIPDDTVVELSHLSRKEHIAKRMRQRSGEEPSEEQAEAQAAQAQLEMQMAQLAVQEQEAKVEKLRAETQLAVAKGETEASKTGLELQREEKKLQINREMADLRAKLAETSAETQLQVSRNAAASKLASTAMQEAGRAAAARMTKQTGGKDGGSGKG